MISSRSFQTLAAAALLVFTGVPAISAPAILNYQSRLTDNLGNPVTTATEITFEFFAAPTGGTRLAGFVHTANVTPDSDGIYTTTIGSDGNPIPQTIFDSNTVYLGERVGSVGGVGGEELLPRQRVLSSAYALRANDADTVDGLDSTDFAPAGLSSLDASDGDPADVLSVDSEGDVTISDGRSLSLESQAGGERLFLGSDPDGHGQLSLRNNNSEATIHFNAGRSQPTAFSGTKGELLISNTKGHRKVLMGTNPSGADPSLNYGFLATFGTADVASVPPLVELGHSGGDGRGGAIFVHREGQERVYLGVDGGTLGGEILLRNTSTTPTIQLLGTNGSISALSCACPSDARLKTDVKPVEGSIDSLGALEPVRFHWKEKERGEAEQIGLLAQDVEKVFPEVVHTSEDGMKAVDYGKLVAPLIGAVNELSELVETQKGEIAAQNARIAALESRLAVR